MGKGQVWGLILLLAVTAAAIGSAQLWPAERMDEPPESESVPLAENACSPDGKYEVRQIDGGGDGEIVPSMETVQVVDRATGEVMWEDSGDCETSALWSPDGGYVALSRRSRAYSAVTVLETAGFTSWEVPLPAEARSAEYAFLHAVEWLDVDTLRFRYQNMQAGSQDPAARFYRCFLRMEDGQLTGSRLEETAETLPGEYDFDHDGKPETVELVTVREPEQERAAWYELHVKKADGTELWSDSAAPQHPGWKSIFAHTMGEKDYLLCFYPTMYQGYADYTYEQIFFDQDGNWALSLRDAVSFDLSFNMPEHEFDAVEIAEFFWNLRGYLQNSTLLLSTENGEFQSDIPGLELQNYCFGELLALDSREKMETALRRWESEEKAEQGVT